MKIVPQSVTLEAITPNAAKLIEMAGRTCWKSEGKAGPDTAGPFIQILKGKHHESVLEHASATFRIITDRGVSHEIVRHRIASYSQESTRYCNYGKRNEIEVIEPPGLTDEMFRRDFTEWADACERAESSYIVLINRGVKPEIARSVLPTCLKTEIVMTANFRSWLHFIRLRTHPSAHPQIREIAEMIQEVLFEKCPEVFADGVDFSG